MQTNAVFQFLKSLHFVVTCTFTVSAGDRKTYNSNFIAHYSLVKINVYRYSYIAGILDE